MSQLPENHNWVQFNYQKFLIDGTVDLVDDASQAIWLKLFFSSLSYEEMGHFKVNGKPLSINEISKKLGRSKRKVERSLGQLLEVGLCERLSDGTIIIPSDKINHFANNLHAKCNQNESKVNAKCNQNEKENDSLPPKNEAPIIKKNKEDIEKKESNPPLVPPLGEPTKKGYRLPDDWMPNENDIAYAQNLNLDTLKVAEDFCDYWHAKSGKDATKVDWSLTWKRWCRNSRKFNNVHHFPKQNQQKSASKPHNLDWMVEEDKQLWGNA